MSRGGSFHACEIGEELTRITSVDIKLQHDIPWQVTTNSCFRLSALQRMSFCIFMRFPTANILVKMPSFGLTLILNPSIAMQIHLSFTRPYLSQISRAMIINIQFSCYLIRFTVTFYVKDIVYHQRLFRSYLFSICHV